MGTESGWTVSLSEFKMVEYGSEMDLSDDLPVYGHFNSSYPFLGVDKD